MAAAPSHTLSLHDALPISSSRFVNSDTAITRRAAASTRGTRRGLYVRVQRLNVSGRSEEHTSELQSHVNLVCRLLLEKKKQEATSVTTLEISCAVAPI